MPAAASASPTTHLAWPGRTRILKEKKQESTAEPSNRFKRTDQHGGCGESWSRITRLEGMPVHFNHRGCAHRSRVARCRLEPPLLHRRQDALIEARLYQAQNLCSRDQPFLINERVEE